MGFQRIVDGVYLVGGSELSDPRDCLVYALDLGGLVMIDSGAGPGWPRIRDNMHQAGLDPCEVHTLVLTHCHVDHIGAVKQAVKDSGCGVVAHDLDADAIESGDPVVTAANWYSMSLPTVKVDRRIQGGESELEFPGGSLRLIHTPGHTPGSMVALLEREGRKILFGQDIHGPFHEQFGSDLERWRESMERLLALEADILCEGHFGVFQPAGEVRNFIESHLRRNA